MKLLPILITKTKHLDCRQALIGMHYSRSSKSYRRSASSKAQILNLVEITDSFTAQYCNENLLF